MRLVLLLVAFIKLQECKGDVVNQAMGLNVPPGLYELRRVTDKEASAIKVNQFITVGQNKDSNSGRLPAQQPIFTPSPVVSSEQNQYPPWEPRPQNNLSPVNTPQAMSHHSTLPVVRGVPQLPRNIDGYELVYDGLPELSHQSPAPNQNVEYQHDHHRDPRNFHENSFQHHSKPTAYNQSQQPFQSEEKYIVVKLGFVKSSQQVPSFDPQQAVQYVLQNFQHQHPQRVPLDYQRFASQHPTQNSPQMGSQISHQTGEYYETIDFSTPMGSNVDHVQSNLPTNIRNNARTHQQPPQQSYINHEGYQVVNEGPVDHEVTIPDQTANIYRHSQKSSVPYPSHALSNQQTKIYNYVQRS